MYYKYEIYVVKKGKHQSFLITTITAPTTALQIARTISIDTPFDAVEVHKIGESAMPLLYWEYINGELTD